MNTEINLIAKSLARSKHSSVIGGKTNGIDDSNNIYTNGFDSNMPDANSDFHICHINDFTQEQLKHEQQRYDENRTISQMLVCAAYHGGPLDYPKASTRSIGNIVQKWDICFEKLQVVLEKEGRENSKSNVARPANSDEEVYERLTGNKLPPNQNEKKNSRKESRKKKKISSSSYAASEDGAGSDEEPKVNEEEFFFAVAESTSKITIHAIRMIKDLLTRGDMFNLLRILGGLCLVRNKLWFFNETIIVDGRTKPFSEAYQEVLELVEATTEQMVQYQVTLVSTTVLHDSASQDWTNPKPFYEGERISHCVQMWWFYVQGLRSDLWCTVPPKLAQKAFAIAVDRTLDILTVRYLHVTPSAKRIDQFRGDVSALLLMSSEVLLYLCGAVHQMFEPRPAPYGGSQVVRSIHAKCRLLLEALSIIVSPLSVLYKTTLDCVKPKLSKTNMSTLKSNEDLTLWLHLLRPTLYHSPRPEELRPESQLVLLAKLAANQPEPIWPLIVQLTLSYDMMVAKLILLHFGAFVPGNAGEPPKGSGNNSACGCPGYGCLQKCLGPADQNWPQAVGSGILNVVLKGKRNRNCLIHALEGLLDKLSSNSWDALNREQLWTHRRPVWLQAVIQLVEPHVFPAVYELTDLMESGKAWTLGHVHTAMKEVLSCLNDLVEIFPISLIRLCLDIETRLPRNVRPLCNSVLTHIVVACLYNIISRVQQAARKEKVAREKLDFLIAFGEALNNLDPDREDLLQLQITATDVLKKDSPSDFEPADHNFEPIMMESSFTICEMVANQILSDENGRVALKSLHRFFCYNVDWIESCLGVSHSMSIADGSIPALIKPWGSEMFPPPSPFDMMHQIGEYRMVRVMEMSHPWDEYLRYILNPGGSPIQEQLLSRRAEYLSLTVQEGDDDVIMRSPTLPPDERKMLETLRDLIRSGMEPNKLKKIQNPA